MWFAFQTGWSGSTTSYDGIGRIDPTTGQVQLVDLDPYVPDAIAFGSDGALWFVDGGANIVGRVAINQSLFPSGGATNTAKSVTVKRSLLLRR